MQTESFTSTTFCPFRNPDPVPSQAKMDDKGEIDNGVLPERFAR